MRSAVALVCTALAVSICGPSLAQTEDERYRIERTDDGYVRLDARTGRMSLCREQSGQLVCRMAADDRAAYERDIDALENRVEALERRIAALEAGQPSAALPSEEEFEQTLSYMERFFRRFFGIVTELDRNFGGGEKEEPLPDRT